MNGAQHCPECGSKMSIKDTGHGGGTTFRIAECVCGIRVETQECQVRRLPARMPGMALARVEAPPPTDTAVSPPASVGGVGGGLSEGSVPSESDPSPKASLLSDPRARARRNRDAEYTAEFERLWVGCDRRGHKEPAARAWEERGKPDADSVIAAWGYYKASLPSWRNPKDVSAWLRIKGHLQRYEPAPVEAVKRAAPFAVRAEEEREDAHVERMASLHFGSGR